jgi:hypothetical protein
MDKLSGWHFVTLVAILCTTLVLLVALGQELGAIASLGVLILGALGFSAAQNYKNNAVSSEQLGQVKELANGNNEALRNQMALERTQAALERQQMREQLDAAHRINVTLAALVPPETKVPEELGS